MHAQKSYFVLHSILSGSYDNKVYIWCDGGQVAVMEGHNKPVTDVKWVSDVIFLSASQDQTIFLWKVNMSIYRIVGIYCKSFNFPNFVICYSLKLSKIKASTYFGSIRNLPMYVSCSGYNIFKNCKYFF